MSPVALQLLRRVATMALVLAAVVFLGSRLLRETGLIGPAAEEMVATAGASVEAARAYGALPSMEPYARAQEQLAAARALLARGELRAAREAAATAREQAVVAQRLALVRHEQLHVQSDATADAVSLEMDKLETLYDQVTPDLPKAQVTLLLSHMKNTRERGAALVLAHEQKDYEKATALEPAARTALAEMRGELEALKR